MTIRALLAALTALALALPAFADETTTSTTTTDQAPAATTTQQTTTTSDDQGNSTTTTTQATTETKVDLNKATAKQLAKVKGITAAKARAIVAYRKKNGDFKTTEDLKNVKGFNKMTEEQLKEILDQLSVS